jgi:hypothetical protein
MQAALLKIEREQDDHETKHLECEVQMAEHEAQL